MSLLMATKLLPLSEYNVFGSPHLDTNLRNPARKASAERSVPASR